VPADRKASIDQLRSTLLRLERIVATVQCWVKPVRRCPRVAHGFGERSGSFEHSLTALVVNANQRANALARQAEEMKSTARLGLVTFSIVTMALALLLALLTLRTLRANNELIVRMSRLASKMD